MVNRIYIIGDGHHGMAILFLGVVADAEMETNRWHHFIRNLIDRLFFANAGAMCQLFKMFGEIEVGLEIPIETRTQWRTTIYLWDNGGVVMESALANGALDNHRVGNWGATVASNNVVGFQLVQKSVPISRTLDARCEHIGVFEHIGPPRFFCCSEQSEYLEQLVSKTAHQKTRDKVVGHRCL